MGVSQPITLELCKEKFTQNTLNLVSINDRFDNESDEVRQIRFDYAVVIERLATKRGQQIGMTEAGRNYSIAITHAEDSCIRAVKAMYS